MAKQEQPKLSAGQIRRGIFAGALAWLFPGLGHAYLGKYGRAAAFFVLVASAVALGVTFDGNLALGGQRYQPNISKLAVAANLALGPVEPVIRQSMYGALIYGAVDGPRLRRVPPDVRAAIETRRERFKRPWSSYGSAYLFVACLMNLLIIVDAWDIGIGRKR